MGCAIAIPLLILLFIFVFFGGIVAFLFFYASRLKKRMKAISDTPLSRVGELHEGLCKVRGQVLAQEEPLLSPLSHKPCIYYRFKVEEQRTRRVSSGSRGGSHVQTYWHSVIDDKKAVHCAIEDQTGRADVELLQAEAVLNASAHERSGMLRDASPELKEMLWEEYGYSTKGLIFNKTVRYSEQIIEDGDVLFVLGDVETRKGQPPCFYKGQNPFIISDRNEAGVLTHYKRKILWCYIGMGVLGAFGVLFGAVAVFILLVMLGISTLGSRTNNGPPPPAAPKADPISAALNDFKSPDPFARGRAADALARMQPDEARRAEVVAALKGLLKDDHWYPPQAAQRALNVWDKDAAKQGGAPNPFPPAPLPPQPRPGGGKPKPPPPPPPPQNEKPEPEHVEVPWNVQPDPVAGERVALDLEGSVPVPFMGVTVPSSYAHSPMIALSPLDNRDKNQVQVYDLRRMKPVGQVIRGSFGNFRQTFALSPDGAYFATIVPKEARAAVEVWSSATGARVCKIEVDADPQMKVSMFNFVWDNHLITLKHKGENVDYEVACTYQVWDVKTGAEVSHFDYDLRFIPRWGTFTPGGHYMVMEHTRGKGEFHIVFWDLRTGKQAGDLRFQGKDEMWGQSSGIAFTPDGEKMAMLWRLADRTDRWFRLFCFEAKTGKKLLDVKISNKAARRGEYPWLKGGTASIQWVPDGSGLLLFDHLLVDYDSGAVVSKIGEEPNSIQTLDRRFFDRDHVTALGGTAHKPKLTIQTLPRADIDAAVKKAREAAKGGAK